MPKPKRCPGRPSKLRPSQWETISKRLALGESLRSLAREFGVSPSAISVRFSEHLPKLKTLAARVAQTEMDLQELPVSEQQTVRFLADDLKAISQNLACVGRLGSETALALFRKSAEHTAKLDDGEGFLDALEAIHSLTRAGNENSKPALALLKIVGESANAANEKPLHSPEQLRRMADLMERKR